jgi:nucleoside-diphosphate-sugar epimerase
LRDRLPVIVLRPCAVYGPRDKEMLTFFRSIKHGIKPAFGFSQNYINFTYVKDLARAVARAIEKDAKSGSIFFIAEKKSYSYSEAGGIIAEILGRKAFNVYVPKPLLTVGGIVSGAISKLRGKPAIFTAEKAKEISRKYWLYNTTRAEIELGFVAPTDFRDGAAETVAWYKENNWL